MSFTYNNNPSAGGIQEVRFLIQDTEKSTFSLEDEEIRYLLTENNDSIYATCAAALETMATRYARKQELSVSNFNQNLDSIYKKLVDRAKYFRSNSITSSHFKVPSISIDSKNTQLENTDNVRPSFGRGILDNPEATHDPFSTDSEDDI